MELGFWIPILSGIPDSFSCILDSKALESGLNKQKFPDSECHKKRFPGFQISLAKISWIPEFGFSYMERPFA